MYPFKPLYRYSEVHFDNLWVHGAKKVENHCSKALFTMEVVPLCIWFSCWLGESALARCWRRPTLNLSFDDEVSIPTGNPVIGQQRPKQIWEKKYHRLPITSISLFKYRDSDYMLKFESFRHCLHKQLDQKVTRKIKHCKQDHCHESWLFYLWELSFDKRLTADAKISLI